MPSATSPTTDKQIQLVYSEILRSAGNKEDFLTLPLELSGLWNKLSITVERTTSYLFDPLPSEYLNDLVNMAKERGDWGDLAAQNLQSSDAFCWWASPVADACCALATASKKLKKNKRQIKYASLNNHTYSPIYKSQQSLLDGDSGDLTPWYAPAMLTFSSGCHGCILATHTQKQLENSDILRSELLTLLLLLKNATFDAVRGSDMSPTAFLLSFVGTQIRALEARIEGYRKITVSIRTVLDKIPDGPVRDEDFLKVVPWAMYTACDKSEPLSDISGMLATITTPGSSSISSTDRTNTTNQRSKAGARLWGKVKTWVGKFKAAYK